MDIDLYWFLDQVSIYGDLDQGQFDDVVELSYQNTNGAPAQPEVLSVSTFGGVTIVTLLPHTGAPYQVEL